MSSLKGIEARCGAGEVAASCLWKNFGCDGWAAPQEVKSEGVGGNVHGWGGQEVFNATGMGNYLPPYVFSDFFIGSDWGFFYASFV